jgi:disulfide bond formation protein DsbB
MNPPGPRPDVTTWRIALYSGLAALVVAGSLHLSLGMGLKACPLCLYQRGFVIAALGSLLVGAVAGGRGFALLGALPAVVAALAVGGYHIYLEAAGKLECPKGILGLGTAPQQAFVAELALALALLAEALPRRPLVALLAVALGGAGAFAAIAAAPPGKPKPTAPYSVALDECRPPFAPPP